MPFDRPRAEEQPGADLRIRKPVTCEPRDLLLLRRQLTARLVASLAHLLAGREQLPARTLGERLHAHGDEQVVCRSQLLACIDASSDAAQPLSVEEMGSGEVRTEPRAAEQLDRLDEVILCLVVGGDE